MRKVLHLVLSFKWFDKIKSGEKRKEYREITNYWNGRLIRPEGFYQSVRFQRGYKKNPETMEFEIKQIYRSEEENDLGLKKVWVIELGREITTQ